MIHLARCYGAEKKKQKNVDDDAAAACNIHISTGWSKKQRDRTVGLFSSVFLQYSENTAMAGPLKKILGRGCVQQKDEDHFCKV